MAKLTPEERAAEKLRLRKLQEEADVKLGLETMGLTSLKITSTGEGLDGLNPSTKEEFMEFADALNKKITQFKSNDEYVPFLEELLVTRLCAGCKFNVNVCVAFFNSSLSYSVVGEH